MAIRAVGPQGQSTGILGGTTQNTQAYVILLTGIVIMALIVFNWGAYRLTIKKSWGAKILGGLCFALEFWWLTIGSNGIIFESIPQIAARLQAFGSGQG